VGVHGDVDHAVGGGEGEQAGAQGHKAHGEPGSEQGHGVGGQGQAQGGPAAEARDQYAAQLEAGYGAGVHCYERDRELSVAEVKVLLYGWYPRRPGGKERAGDQENDGHTDTGAPQ
jgi:hypothetical protein